VGKGLILGTLFSVINFVLIGEILPFTLGYSKRKTFLISFGFIIIRFLIMAVPLVLAVKFENFNLFAVIPGLLMIQLVIFADHLFRKLSSNRRTIKKA
jgi:fatty acid desaturase